MRALPYPVRLDGGPLERDPVNVGGPLCAGIEQGSAEAVGGLPLHRRRDMA